jgi:hypothetical protein
MADQVRDVYIGELSNIVAELSEEKVRRVVAFARCVKEEEKPAAPLGPEEILTLALERATELRRQPRPVVEEQYQTLLQALEAEVTAKGVEVEEFPRGD